MGDRPPTEHATLLLKRLEEMSFCAKHKIPCKPSSNEATLSIVAGAREKCISENMLLELKTGIFIVGDIHGNFEFLVELFQKMKVQGRKYTRTPILFLGDYVDRGPESLACAEFLAIACQLFPEIYLLRGNHETRSMNGGRENSFWADCLDKCPSKEDALVIYNIYNEWFDCLSLAALVGGKIFCVHGCPVLNVTLEDIRKIKKPLREFSDDSIASLLMWTDPSRAINVTGIAEKATCIFHSSRNCGRLMNEKALEQWMKANNIKAIYRGHQFAPLGIDICCCGRVVTVFSSAEYDDKNNIPAIVYIRLNFTREFHFYLTASGKNKKILNDDIESKWIAKSEHDMVDTAIKSNLQVNETVAEQTASAPPPAEKEAHVKKSTEKLKESDATGTGAKTGLSTSTTTLLVATIICLLCPTVFAAPSPPSNALSQFATNSSILARFVNGISLGQSISEGNLDKKKLIEELFYLGPHVTLDSLAASNVTELTSQLDSIQKVIEAKCTEDNGCGVPSSILSSMKTVVGFQEHVKVIEAAKEASETGGMDLLTQLSAHLTKIKERVRDNIGTQLVMTFHQIESNFTDILFDSLHDQAKKLTELNNLLKEVPPMLDGIEAKVGDGLKSKLESILQMKIIVPTLHNQKPSFDSLLNWLDLARTSYPEIASSLNNEISSKIIQKLDVLDDLASSTKGNKLLTAGFVNGFDDLKKAITVDQDSWLKEFINLGVDLNATSSIIASIKPLSEKLNPISSSFEKVKSSHGNYLSNLKLLLTENSGVMTELSELLLQYRYCFSQMQFEDTFDVDVQAVIDWTNKKSTEVPEGLKGSILELIGDQKNPLNVVLKFADSATVGSIPDKAEVKRIITVLNSYESDLSKLNGNGFRKLTQWLKSGKVTEVTTSTKDWIDRSRFLIVMDCFKQRMKMLPRIEALTAPAKNIALLRTGYKDIQSTFEMITSVSSLIEEWTELESSFSSKSKRAAESNLENAQKISKDLGDISSITVKLDGMLKSKNVLNALIGGKQAIESAIGKVKDQKEQDRLKNMWTPGNLGALQKNLATAEAVSDVVSKNKIVGNMTDFEAPFEKASEVQECSIDIKRLASSLKGMIQDQTVAASLESSKALDLQFVKYDQARVGGVITGLQSYFDSVFGSKSSKLKQKQCKDGDSSCSGDADESKGLTTTEKVIIGVVCFVIFVVAVGMLWFRKALIKWFKSIRSKGEKKDGKNENKKQSVTIPVKSTPITHATVKSTTPVVNQQRKEKTPPKKDKRRNMNEVRRRKRKSAEERNRIREEKAKEQENKVVPDVVKEEDGALKVYDTNLPIEPININEIAPNGGKVETILGRLTKEMIERFTKHMKEWGLNDEQIELFFDIRKLRWAALSTLIFSRVQTKILEMWLPLRPYMYYAERVDYDDETKPLEKGVEPSDDVFTSLPVANYYYERDNEVVHDTPEKNTVSTKTSSSTKTCLSHKTKTKTEQTATEGTEDVPGSSMDTARDGAGQELNNEENEEEANEKALGVSPSFFKRIILFFWKKNPAEGVSSENESLLRSSSGSDSDSDSSDEEQSEDKTNKEAHKALYHLFQMSENKGGYSNVRDPQLVQLEAADREAHQVAVREAQEAADREAQEAADREAHQAAVREAQEAADREAQEAADREAHQAAVREAQEAADSEAQELAKKSLFNRIFDYFFKKKPAERVPSENDSLLKSSADYENPAEEPLKKPMMMEEGYPYKELTDSEKDEIMRIGMRNLEEQSKQFLIDHPEFREYLEQQEQIEKLEKSELERDETDKKEVVIDMHDN
ncbi:unnamed protein product [Caenorhabditis brenneri]